MALAKSFAEFNEPSVRRQDKWDSRGGFLAEALAHPG
jgi:hypothetical protein